MILLHRNSSCCYLSVQNDVQTEITLDVAEPFGLDPDFDYDNVQLSAKFTVEQWRGDAVRGQVQQWGRVPNAHCSGVAQKACEFETLEWVVAQCGMPINL